MYRALQLQAVSLPIAAIFDDDDLGTVMVLGLHGDLETLVVLELDGDLMGTTVAFGLGQLAHVRDW